MILKDKKILITGILTDKSIAYASAKLALETVQQLLQLALEKAFALLREL